MKLLITTTIILIACLTAKPLHAQVDVSKTDEGRQATRCAVFYLLMSKVPAMAANDKTRLEGLVDGLARIANENGSTNEEMNSWAKEYMAEAVENSKKPDESFNQDQSKACELFLATHGATRIPASPSEEPQ